MSSAEETPSIDPNDFRRALARFATGVTVITMVQGEDVYGITVSAFMSVSLTPPLVLVSVDQKAKAHATLRESERYGVSILREGQEVFSNHFAGRVGEELDVPYTYLGGFPLLEGAAAGLVCRITDVHDAGDHTLFIGRVEHLFWGDEKPLLYHAGGYGGFVHPEKDSLLED